jgi:type VI secretion system protein ImpC
MIGEFVQQLWRTLVLSRDVETTIMPVSPKSTLLSAQLNEVLMRSELQKLEGSWRGLHHLVMNSEAPTEDQANVSKKISAKTWKAIELTSRPSSRGL